MRRRLLTFAGWVFAAFVVTMAVVVLVRAHGHPDYWSVAWPGVLTGCGTLAVAAVTYRVLLGDQEDRRKRDRQDELKLAHERRAQAARVQISEAIPNGGSGQSGQFMQSIAQRSLASRYRVTRRGRELRIATNCPARHPQRARSTERAGRHRLCICGCPAWLVPRPVPEQHSRAAGSLVGGRQMDRSDSCDLRLSMPRNPATRSCDGIGDDTA